MHWLTHWGTYVFIYMICFNHVHGIVAYNAMVSRIIIWSVGQKAYIIIPYRFILSQYIRQDMIFFVAVVGRRVGQITAPHGCHWFYATLSMSSKHTYWYYMIMNWLVKTELMDDKHHCGHMVARISVNIDLSNDLLTDGTNVANNDLSSNRIIFRKCETHIQLEWAWNPNIYIKSQVAQRTMS